MFFCNFLRDGRLFLMTCFISTKLRGKPRLMYLSTITARETTSSGIIEANLEPSYPYTDAFFLKKKKKAEHQCKSRSREHRNLNNSKL